MSYRDELDAARLRIEALEAELAALRGNAVQWTPEEVIELREALYAARLESTRERREREQLQNEIEQTRAAADRERGARAILEAALREGRFTTTEGREDTALRRELFAAQMEIATERREREHAVLALAGANADAEAERRRRQLLENALEHAQHNQNKLQQGVIIALRAALQTAEDRERTLEAQLVSLRMWARTAEARHTQVLLRLSEHEPTPMPATLSDTDVAAFRELFSPAMAELPDAKRQERLQELLLRIAASIFDGKPYTPESIEPALSLLRAAGHALKPDGDGRFVCPTLELELGPDRLVLIMGEDRAQIAGTG